MSKTQITSWIQIVFMFLLILLLMPLIGHYISPMRELVEIEKSLGMHCITTFYSYTPTSVTENSYMAAICQHDGNPLIVRYFSSNALKPIINNSNDVISFFILLSLSLVAWGKYLYSIFSKYWYWLNLKYFN